MTILLIDDYPSIREVLRLDLESEGDSVREAADCRENEGRKMARVSHARSESGKPAACEGSIGLP